MSSSFLPNCRFINSAAVHKLCAGNLKQQIELQRRVFMDFELKKAMMGPRVIIGVKETDAHFSYIARASEKGPTCVKMGSFVPSNPTQRGTSVVHAYINVLDYDSGELTAMLDGESITELRTAAGSALAASTASCVQNPNTESLKIAIVGPGVIGTATAKLVTAMLLSSQNNKKLKSLSISMCGRNPTPTPQQEETISSLQKEFQQDEANYKNNSLNSISVSYSNDILGECAKSDLVFLCTNSPTSIFPEEGFDFKNGSMVISVGSFAANRSEISSKILERQNVVKRIMVDDVETSLKQCGPIVGLSGDEESKRKKIVSIGNYLLNTKNNQQQDEDEKQKDGVEFYFSVGLGIQDAVVAEFLLTQRE
jgi:ornithine cyclodeaminase/alanine dehydrogenase-like protein (mu-crystallin family)